MALESSVRLGVSLEGGWSKAARILGQAPFRLKAAQQLALRQEAEWFQKKIKEGIRSQAPAGQRFKPLSPYTIAMRVFLRLRSENALIERGDLLRGIVCHRIDADNYFVGIMRNATNRDGRSLEAIAKIQEYGAGPFVIRLTPKMKKFLAMAFRKLHIPPRHGGHGKGYMVITIPPRPFMNPVFEKYGKASLVEARMKERVGKLLFGVFA